ncbi:MAG: Crp/Fnr family transcriptional regulator, partial [Methylocaldum sp.]|nr:Crp/Fnr family transcriptional regulator [Methylocaldum sp.]
MLEVHKFEYSSNTNMPPALSASDAQELRRLIPLNTLSDSRFEQLCSQIRIDEAPKGSILFRQGETKNEFVYLLSGTISLQAGGVEMDSISGGTDTARFALAHQIPRKVSAVANDTVRYVRI